MLRLLLYDDAEGTDQRTVLWGIPEILLYD